MGRCWKITGGGKKKGNCFPLGFFDRNRVEKRGPGPRGVDKKGKIEWKKPSSLTNADKPGPPAFQPLVYFSPLCFNCTRKKNRLGAVCLHANQTFLTPGRADSGLVLVTETVDFERFVGAPVLPQGARHRPGNEFGLFRGKKGGKKQGNKGGEKTGGVGGT